MAYAMVTQYGMNDKIGTLAFPEKQDAFGGSSKRYSEKTAEIIDQEVIKLVDTAYRRTKDLLTEKSAELKMLAECLLEKETISQHDIEGLIGKRPWSYPSTYEEFVQASAHLGDEKKIESEDSIESKENDEETEKKKVTTK